MESSIMDNMTEYKFLMFENEKNNCWLDASVSLIAYNSTIRKLVKDFPESSVIYKIISLHDASIFFLNDSGNDDLEDRLKKTRRKLLEIQTCTMRYLQPYLKYKFGEPDSAHCALLNLILKDKSNIKEHLNASWLWKMVCENCNKKTKSSIFTKPIITLSNVKKFHPECPTSVYMCSCKTEQEMTLIYKELPPCLIFHFEKGAGDGESFPLNFKIKDREYQLTGVIIMEKSNDPFVNHFITLIRDTSSNMWLDCNDLNTSVVSFSSKQPEWNLKDVYVYMFESFDNMGKVINELSADEVHAIENLVIELVDLSDEDDGRSISENSSIVSELPKNETGSNILKQDSENVDAAKKSTNQNNTIKDPTKENIKQNNEKEDSAKNKSLFEKNVEKFVNSIEQAISKKEKEMTETTIDYRKIPVSNLRYVPKKQSIIESRYSQLFDESVKSESKRENLKPGESGDEGTKAVNPLSENESTDVDDGKISTKTVIQNNKNVITESKIKQIESSKVLNDQNIRSVSSNSNCVSQMSHKPKFTADVAAKAKVVHEINSQRFVKGESFNRNRKNSPPSCDSNSVKEKNLLKIKKMIPKTENSLEVTKKIRDTLKSLHSSENLTKIKTEKVVADGRDISKPQIAKQISNGRENTLKTSESQMARDLFGSDSEQSQDNPSSQTPDCTPSETPGKKTNENSNGFPTCDEGQETREREPFSENELESKMKKVPIKRSSTSISSQKKRKVLEKKQLSNSDEITNANVRKIKVLKYPKRKEKIKTPKSPKRKEKVKLPKSTEILEQMTVTKSAKKISEHTVGKNERGSKENGHKGRKSKKINEELVSHNAKHERNRFIKGNKTDWEQQVELLVDTVVDKTFTAFIDTLFSGGM